MKNQFVIWFDCETIVFMSRFLFKNRERKIPQFPSCAFTVGCFHEIFFKWEQTHRFSPIFRKFTYSLRIWSYSFKGTEASCLSLTSFLPSNPWWWRRVYKVWFCVTFSVKKSTQTVVHCNSCVWQNITKQKETKKNTV